jgi:hypothetical protein
MTLVFVIELFENRKVHTALTNLPLINIIYSKMSTTNAGVTTYLVLLKYCRSPANFPFILK